MKNLVPYLLLLILGGVIGYFIGTNNYSSVENSIVKKDTKIVEQTKIIKDTVVIEKVIPKKVESNLDTLSIDSLLIDTLNLDLVDSLTYDLTELSDSTLIEDSVEINEEADFDDEIIQELLLSQRSLQIAPSSRDTEEDVDEMLELKANAFSSTMIVEFWQSPLNLTGYELTRNKLKLFGFNPNENISLQLSHEEDKLFLNTETMSLILEKSTRFKTLSIK